jgi:hypothetical protein
MLPKQRKLSLFVMFEFRLFPPMRDMTGLAFITVATSVLVITAMTGNTFSTRLIGMQFPTVANIALHFTVFS